MARIHNRGECCEELAMDIDRLHRSFGRQVAYAIAIGFMMAVVNIGLLALAVFAVVKVLQLMGVL